MQNTEFNRLKLLLDTLYFPLSGGRINGKTIFSKTVQFLNTDKKKKVSIQNGMIEGANVSYFGICDAEQGDKQFKSVKIQGVEDFALRVGTSIAVKFATTNTFPATPTAPISLDVNGTGIKNIYYDTGIPTGTDVIAFGKANTTNLYMYDGTYWVFVGSGGGGSGGEGHSYDLVQSSDKSETTLTEDGADKTTLPVVATFVGTRAEWDALSSTDKAKYRILHFTDETVGVFSHVGQIIESTTLDTEAKVKAIYGSNTSWIQHAGYVLRGASSSVTANQASNDGGADSVTVSSVASHNHTQNGHHHGMGIVNLYYASGGINTGAANQYGVAGTYLTGDTTATNKADGADYTVNTLPKYKNVYIWERVS